MSTVQILIPVLNERNQLPELIENIRTILDQEKIAYNLVFVDDGSSDGSGDIIDGYRDRLPVTCLRHEKNKGVSTAFRTGFDYILEHSSSGDPVLTMEANKNSDPKLIPDMLNLMRNGAHLVLASCYAPGGNVIGDPLFRLILSKGINFILRILFPAGVHTYTSFYLLWSHELLLQIREATNGKYFYQDGFVCMADMLLIARRIPGTAIREVPFILISDTGESGSKMKIGRTILGYFNLIYSNAIASRRRK